MKGGGKGMFLRMFTGAQTWLSDFRTRVQEEGGATAVEYALMIALIAAVIIVAVTFIGNAADTKFQSVGTAINGAGS
jgi:pilus assembly protein Flp/PilA